MSRCKSYHNVNEAKRWIIRCDGDLGHEGDHYHDYVEGPLVAWKTKEEWRSPHDQRVRST